MPGHALNTIQRNMASVLRFAESVSKKIKPYLKWLLLTLALLAIALFITIYGFIATSGIILSTALTYYLFRPITAFFEKKVQLHYFADYYITAPPFYHEFSFKKLLNGELSLSKDFDYLGPMIPLFCILMTVPINMLNVTSGLMLAYYIGIHLLTLVSIGVSFAIARIFGILASSNEGAATEEGINSRYYWLQFNLIIFQMETPSLVSLLTLSFFFPACLGGLIFLSLFTVIFPSAIWLFSTYLYSENEEDEGLEPDARKNELLNHLWKQAKISPAIQKANTEETINAIDTADDLKTKSNLMKATIHRALNLKTKLHTRYDTAIKKLSKEQIAAFENEAKDFSCAITYEIMDEPVKLGMIYYERLSLIQSNIHRLDQGQLPQNPMTREKIDDNFAYAIDTSKQNEIKAFVQRLETAAEASNQSHSLLKVISSAWASLWNGNSDSPQFPSPTTSDGPPPQHASQ